MKKMDLLTLTKVMDATFIPSRFGEDILLEREVENITQDSRKVNEKSMYVAIIGERLDGHEFVAECFEKGAVACLSEKLIAPTHGGALLLVEDVRKALLKLAAYYRDQFDIPFVGITGSVGKTTTKDMVASVVSQKYRTLATQGNYNNDIGVPLTLFGLDDSHEAAIIEMGMNHFGEIHALTEVVRPQIGLVSNVGVAHIEYLGSREGILQAKLEMFDSMDENGVAIFNADNDMLLSMDGKMEQRQVWFGVKNKKGIYADNLEVIGLEKTKCTMHTPIGDVEVLIPIPGEHMVLNAVSAAAVGLELGLSLDEIKRGIESFVPTKNRMSVMKENGFTILNDVYNSNPVSAKASLDILATGEGRRVAILGFMGELGEFAEEMHKDIGAYAGERADVLFFIGKHADMVEMGANSTGIGKIECFETQEDFWQKGISQLEKGDVVLVKGSRSMQLEKTVEKIRGVNE